MQKETKLPDEASSAPKQKNDSNTEESTPIQETKESMAQLENQLSEAYGKHEELQSKYLRICADFDNLRKRSIRDREEAVKRTRVQIIEDLLPVTDAFRIGLEEALKQEPDGPVVKGFKMAIDQFDNVLKEYGLVSIMPDGLPFDPKFHDAIGYELSDQDAVVLRTIRVGYRLKDTLLRPASVVVSKLESHENTE